MKTELSDRKIVRQSHSLNFSKFSLSALSIDILFLFFAQIAKEDEEFKEFKITFRELEKKLNKRIDKDYIDKVCEELLTNPLRIQEEKSVLRCNFVSSARYSKEESWLQLKVSDDLKEHLLKVEKNYVLSNYLSISKLKGSYTKRIYSILSQFKKTGFYKVDVEKLMYILDLENKYQKYGDFKRRILNSSMKEINEKSDIEFSFKEITENLKVVRLEFFIKTKKSLVDDSHDFVDEYNQLISKYDKKAKEKGCEGSFSQSDDSSYIDSLLEIRPF